jgi:hypothetical protein
MESRHVGSASWAAFHSWRDDGRVVSRVEAKQEEEGVDSTDLDRDTRRDIM